MFDELIDEIVNDKASLILELHQVALTRGVGWKDLLGKYCVIIVTTEWQEWRKCTLIEARCRSPHLLHICDVLEYGRSVENRTRTIVDQLASDVFIKSTGHGLSVVQHAELRSRLSSDIRRADRKILDDGSNLIVLQ